MCENPYNITEEQLEEQKRLDDEYNKELFEWELSEKRKANAASAKKT